MRNYMYHKCETLVQNSSRPNPLNCPEGGTHQWTDLGAVGDKNYQCKKCGVLVEASGLPCPLNCPSSGTHQWTKL